MDQRKYQVCRWRYLAIFLLSVGLALACYSVAPEFRRPGKFYFLAAVMTLVSPFALWEFVAATDLLLDARGIRYKRRSIGWSEVRAICVVQQDVETRMGLIPQWSSRDCTIGDVRIEQRHTSVAYPGFVIPGTTRNDRIVIETTRGKVNINGRSLVLPSGGLIEIAQRMTDFQRMVLGEDGAARARLGLEQKQAQVPSVEPAAALEPQRPAFGRKGVARPV